MYTATIIFSDGETVAAARAGKPGVARRVALKRTKYLGRALRGARIVVFDQDGMLVEAS